jgi:hypothetical protein
MVHFRITVCGFAGRLMASAQRKWLISDSGLLTKHALSAILGPSDGKRN